MEDYFPFFFLFLCVCSVTVRYSPPLFEFTRVFSSLPSVRVHDGGRIFSCLHACRIPANISRFVPVDWIVHAASFEWVQPSNSCSTYVYWHCKCNNCQLSDCFALALHQFALSQEWAHPSYPCPMHSPLSLLACQVLTFELLCPRFTRQQGEHDATDHAYSHVYDLFSAGFAASNLLCILPNLCVSG